MGNNTRIPGHIAIVVARSDWLMAKIREERLKRDTPEDKVDRLQVRFYLTLRYPTLGEDLKVSDVKRGLNLT